MLCHKIAFFYYATKICKRCFIFTLLFCTFIRAENYSIKILTPQPGTQVSGKVQIKVFISDEGKPLSIKDGLHWVSAVLQTGNREILRIILLDSGQYGDTLANDGYWNTPMDLELPNGRYTFYILAKKSEELIRSSIQAFNIKSERAGISSHVTTRKDQDTSVGKDYLKEEMNNAKGILGNIQSLMFAILLLIVTAIIIIGIMKLIPTLKKRKEDKTFNAVEQWGPIFSSLEKINGEVSDANKSISGTYHIHRRLQEKYARLTAETIEIYDFAKEWSDAPHEYTEPFKAKLKEVLDKQGIEEWIPEIGKLSPDGCKKTPAAKKEDQYPQGTVMEVLSPGFRIKENEEYKVVKSPLVVVAL